ncbi:MAG: hydroxymethylpyrimidine ABC transporter substrate-binding protein [Desulfuromonas sp.]|nr:MAG: hydroxymethylpyrimidine ABC transporter substrate-binding protein [Desulfuromonas sp.]
MLWSRRDFLWGLAGVLSFPLMGGCSKSLPCRIAAHPWPGYELMFLARDEGWIRESLAVELCETRSATESLALLREGKADGAALTLDEVLRARDEGISLTVVLVFDVSAGADVIMATPKIKQLQDLKGQTVGVEKSALGAYMLHLALREANLSEAQVKVHALPVDQQLDACRCADAFVTYEPVATRLEKAGMHRLFDSRQIPAAIFDVLAVKESVLNRHRLALQGMTQGYFRALEHFRRNPYDAAFRMTSRIPLSADEILGGFRGLDLPNLVQNRHFLSGKKSNLLQAAKKMSDVMVSAGLLNAPASLHRLVSATYLPRG